jgi:hypothetical protein
VLYNKILLDPWDEIFRDSKLRGQSPADWGIDSTTYHFIDAVNFYSLGAMSCVQLTQGAAPEQRSDEEVDRAVY